jgi:hypothetical protein
METIKNMGEDYQENEEATYKIYDRKSRVLLGEGTFRWQDGIKCLLPDSQSIRVFVDGVEMNLNSETTAEVVTPHKKMTQETETIVDSTVKATQLTKIVHEAVKYTSENYGKNVSACNISVEYAFNKLTDSNELKKNDSDPMMANQMFDYLVKSSSLPSPRFQRVQIENVQELANQGNIIIAAYKNSTGSGHVALAVPEKTEKATSGKWWKDGKGKGKNGTDVDKIPYVMDTGKEKRSVCQRVTLSWGSDIHKDVIFFMYIGHQ